MLGKQPMKMDDEIALVRTIDALLRLGLPGRIGISASGTFAAAVRR